MTSTFSVGDTVVILEPFGDGQTPFQIAAIQGVDSAGQIVEAGSPAAAYQYQVEGSYFAQHFLAPLSV